MTTTVNFSDQIGNVIGNVLQEVSKIRDLVQDIEITSAVQEKLDHMVEQAIQSDIHKAMKEAFHSNDFGVILAKLQKKSIVIDLEMINDHDLMSGVRITHNMKKSLRDMIDNHFGNNVPERIKEAFQSNYLGVVFLALQKEQIDFDLAWINKSGLFAGEAITNHAKKVIYEIIDAHKEAKAGVINQSGIESQIESLICRFGVSEKYIRETLVACEHAPDPDMQLQP